MYAISTYIQHKLNPKTCKHQSSSFIHNFNNVIPKFRYCNAVSTLYTNIASCYYR